MARTAAKQTEEPAGNVVSAPAPVMLNIFQRLHRVMEDVDYIQKEKKQGMRYTIVSHDAVTAKVRPALVRHGVIYYPVAMQMGQNGNRTEGQLTIRFQNIDDRADFIDVVSAGYGIDDQDKGPGKAISYAVKYALLKALGLESGDDPDHDQETPHVNAQQQQTEAQLARTVDLAIDGATSAAALVPLDQQIRADYAAGKVSKVEAQRLINKIKAKVTALIKTLEASDDGQR